MISVEDNQNLRVVLQNKVFGFSNKIVLGNDLKMNNPPLTYALVELLISIYCCLLSVDTIITTCHYLIECNIIKLKSVEGIQY